MSNGKDIPMRVAKERTGLTSRQIRYYDQMKLVFPERTKGNQRLFSEDDIIRLGRIKNLLEEGYTIEAIKNKLNTPNALKSKNNLQVGRWGNRLNKGDLSSHFPELNKKNKNK